MRLLIHEKAYHRTQAAVAAHGAAVEPLLVSDAGEITLAGAPVTPDAAAPDG